MNREPLEGKWKQQGARFRDRRAKPNAYDLDRIDGRTGRRDRYGHALDKIEQELERRFANQRTGNEHDVEP